MVIFVSDLSSGFPLSLDAQSWSLPSHPRGIHSAEEKTHRRPISLCLNTYQISNSVDTRVMCMAWLWNYMLLSHWRCWPQVVGPKILQEEGISPVCVLSSCWTLTRYPNNKKERKRGKAWRGVALEKLLWNLILGSVCCRWNFCFFFLGVFVINYCWTFAMSRFCLLRSSWEASLKWNLLFCHEPRRSWSCFKIDCFNISCKKANLNLIFLFAFLIATSEKGASRKLRSASGDDKRKEKKRLHEKSCAADNKGRNIPT